MTGSTLLFFVPVGVLFVIYLYQENERKAREAEEVVARRAVARANAETYLAASDEILAAIERAADALFDVELERPDLDLYLKFGDEFAPTVDELNTYYVAALEARPLVYDALNYVSPGYADQVALHCCELPLLRVQALYLNFLDHCPTEIQRFLAQLSSYRGMLNDWNEVVHDVGEIIEACPYWTAQERRRVCGDRDLIGESADAPGA